MIVNKIDCARCAVTTNKGGRLMKQKVDIIVQACIDVDRWIPDQKAIEKKIGGYLEESIMEALHEVMCQSFGDGPHPKVDFICLDWDEPC